MRISCSALFILIQYTPTFLMLRSSPASAVGSWEHFSSDTELGAKAEYMVWTDSKIGQAICLGVGAGWVTALEERMCSALGLSYTLHCYPEVWASRHSVMDLVRNWTALQGKSSTGQALQMPPEANHSGWNPNLSNPKPANPSESRTTVPCTL